MEHNFNESPGDLMRRAERETTFRLSKSNIHIFIMFIIALRERGRMAHSRERTGSEKKSD